MSEQTQQYEAHRVTIDTYLAGLGMRCSAAEVAKPLRSPDKKLTPEEQLAQFNFILRLLDPDNETAHDQLVKVVGADDLLAANVTDGPRPLLVSVRPVLEDGTLGELRAPYVVAEDGIVLNNNEHTPNIERGYFVGTPGMNGEAFYDSVKVRVPSQKDANADAAFLEYQAQFTQE